MLKKFKSYEKVQRMILDYESGITGVALAAKHGVTPAAVCWWVTHYSGLDAKWIKLILDLKHEVVLLKRLCKRQDNLLLAGANVIRHFQPNPRKRGPMAIAIRAKYGLNRRDAARVMGLGPQSRTAHDFPRDDAILIRMMKSYFSQNPGQGFGLAFKALLRNQPHTRAHTYRVYKYCGYRMKDRPKEKTAVPYRISKPMEKQSQPDQVWSMDFLTDVLPSGKRYWILNAIDDFNREAVIIKVLGRNTSTAVVAALEEVRRTDRTPAAIRTDNGGEFKSNVYERWTRKHGVTRRYIKPGKPYENSYVERFNGTFRCEVLSRYEFQSILEVQRMADDWRVRYNLSRPNFVLGGLSPIQYAQVAKLEMAGIRSSLHLPAT